ncbi:hypothetical protein CRYUN_Cryun24cG0107100 [Craigia yunnanensis]
MDGWQLQFQTLARVSELYGSVSEGNKSKEGFSHIQGLERKFLNQVRDLSVESGGKGSAKKDLNNQRNLFKDVLEFLEGMPYKFRRALDAFVKVGPCSLPGSRVGGFGGQVILPLTHTIEHEELPWRPLISIDGSTFYELDEKFTIVRHAESWNVFALEAIGQIFIPNFGRLYY